MIGDMSIVFYIDEDAKMILHLKPCLNAADLLPERWRVTMTAIDCGSSDKFNLKLRIN